MPIYQAMLVSLQMFCQGTCRSTLMRLLPLLLLVLVVTGPAHAQDQTNLRIVQVDASRAPQIEFTVDYSLINGQPSKTDPSFVVRVANQPVELSAQRRNRLPINVAMVADLSARMSDQGAPYTTRFQNMAPLVMDLVSQLQADLNYASLITFNATVTIPNALDSDLQAIANTLTRSNTSLIFEPQPLIGANPKAVYPLYDAIRTAIAQLVAGEIRPRALVIFAAGPIDPDQIALLRKEIEPARNDRAPIQVLVFSFGSPKTFTTFPAGTQALSDLATALDGQFIDLGNDLLSVASRQKIDQQFNAIIRRGEHWVLTVNVPTTPAGSTTLRVEAGGSVGETTFQLPELPPRVTIEPSNPVWNGAVTLTIKQLVAQAPITRVQYVLDNYPLGEATDSTNGFAYTFSTEDRTFLARFPQGKHTLTAIVTDQRGLENPRDSNALTITVAAPPPVNPLDWLLSYWWVVALVILGVGILILGAIILRTRGKATTTVGTEPQVLARSDEEGPTVRYGPDAPPLPPTPLGYSPLTEPLDDPDETQRVDDDIDEETGRYGPENEVHATRWQLSIIEGADPQTISLQERRHYDIGRPTTKGHQPHILVNNRLVSRNHATLERLLDSLELIARETENGTFFGEERRLLQVDERVALKAGDVFWLSPRVKLRVESES